VRQLGEIFGTNIALEGPFTGVSPKMNLEVAQLAKDLIAGFTLVFNLSIFLLKREGEGLVATVHGVTLGVLRLFYKARHHLCTLLQEVG